MPPKKASKKKEKVEDVYQVILNEIQKRVWGCEVEELVTAKSPSKSKTEVKHF